MIPKLTRGGAELQLSQLARHQATDGHTVAVWSMTASPEMRTDLETNDPPVELVVAASLTPLAIVRWYWRLRRRSRDVDVLHSWMYHAFVLSIAARRIRSGPAHVWGVRRTDPISVGLSRRTRFVVRTAAFLSRRVSVGLLCCSAAAMHRHTEFGFRGRRQAVAYNAVSTPLFGDDAVEPAERPRGPVVGVLSRWSEDKGIDVVIEAWSLAHPQLPADVELVLAGPGLDGANADLAVLIERHGVCDANVRLVGPTSSPARFHAGLDLLVSPSRTEGFPNVVAEAMAAGVPVVATDVGGTAEVLGRNDLRPTGLLVPSERADLLAAAIIELITDPARGRRLGEAGRNRIGAEFSIERTAASTEAFYRRLRRALGRNT
ncbi:MAG: glycosyltransferase [Actinomycetota bacterium]